MKLTSREKKSVMAGAGAIVVFLLLQYVILPGWDRTENSTKSLLLAQKELRKRRELIASGGGLRAQTAALEARLTAEERRLWSAPDAGQAGAQMQAWLVQRATEQQLEVLRSDFLPTKPVGSSYVQVPVQMELSGRITQLMQFFNGIVQGDKIISVEDFQVTSPGATKDKRLRCVVTIAGLMAKTS